MAKYTPLEEYLKGQNETEISVRFADIEEIIGSELPASAREYLIWWDNNSASSHVQARAWLNAGYHTEYVDIASEKLTFVRVR